MEEAVVRFFSVDAVPAYVWDTMRTMPEVTEDIGHFKAALRTLMAAGVAGVWVAFVDMKPVAFIIIRAPVPTKTYAEILVGHAAPGYWMQMKRWHTEPFEWARIKGATSIRMTTSLDPRLWERWFGFKRLNSLMELDLGTYSTVRTSAVTAGD